MSGLFDWLFGIRKLPKPDIDNLFKLPIASVTMQDAMGIKPAGNAGLCFRAFDTREFEEVKEDISRILSINESGMKYWITKDEYDFTWVVLEDPQLENLVAGMHMVSELLADAGFGQYILCAVFGFLHDNEKIYWVYAYKRGKFYPFIPRRIKGKDERDIRLELHLKSLVSGDIPVEDLLENWFPIWGIPF